MKDRRAISTYYKYFLIIATLCLALICIFFCTDTCYAESSKDAEDILEENVDENLSKLLYNVGKFVYLADAIDDLDEDFKKKRYNPMLAAYGAYSDRKSFIRENKSELTFLLASTVNRAIECFNRITFTGASDLLKNIVHKGLRGKCEELLTSEKKLPPPKI